MHAEPRKSETQIPWPSSKRRTARFSDSQSQFNGQNEESEGHLAVSRPVSGSVVGRVDFSQKRSTHYPDFHVQGELAHDKYRNMISESAQGGDEGGGGEAGATENPAKIETSLKEDVQTNQRVGMMTKSTIKSDGGQTDNINPQAKVKEYVKFVSRRDPLKYYEGDLRVNEDFVDASHEIIDDHTMSLNAIDEDGLEGIEDGGTGEMVFHQLHTFKPNDAGDEQVIPKSGFEIKHSVWIEKNDEDEPVPHHKVTKSGKSVTVDGKQAQSGEGSANSQDHDLSIDAPGENRQSDDADDNDDDGTGGS